MNGDGSVFEQEIEGLSDLTSLSDGEYLRVFAGEYDGERPETRQVQLRTPQADPIEDDLTEAIVTTAQNWRKAATHPNIVEVVDWGTEPRPWVLTTDIRTSLETSLSALSLPESVDAVTEAAEGLRNAALYNTTHGNLTPGNVKVVDGDPMALVDDWGLERAVATHVDDSYVTPYTAPEQIDSSFDGDGATIDVYGLGAVAYYALTGQPPFPAKEDAILTEPLATPSEYRAQIPPEVDDLLLGTLSREPADRPDSVLQFVNQFERATDGMAAGYAGRGAADQRQQPEEGTADGSPASGASTGAGAGAGAGAAAGVGAGGEGGAGEGAGGGEGGGAGGEGGSDGAGSGAGERGGTGTDTGPNESTEARGGPPAERDGTRHAEGGGPPNHSGGRDARHGAPASDPGPGPGPRDAGDDPAGGSGTRRAVLALLGVGAATAGGGYLLMRDLDFSDGPSTGAVADTTDTPTDTPTERDRETATETETPTETATATATGRPDATLKIGVLQPFSGPLEVYGKLAMWGYYTALGMRGVPIGNLPPADAGAGDYSFEIGDTTYEFFARDTRYSASEAQSLAGNLVQYEDVDVLLGVTNSSAAQNIAGNIASRANIPYLAGPAPTPDLTNEDRYCDEYVFRTSETTAMDAITGAKYLTQTAGFNSVWSYHADHSLGNTLYRYYSDTLEDNGASVLGSTALPAGYSEDWAGHLQKAEKAGADVAIAGFTVATLPQLIRAYLQGDYSFRLVSGFTTMAGMTALGSVVEQALDETFTRANIYNAGLGPFTTRYHWNQYDNEYAREANEIYRQKYGQNTDFYTAGAHAAVSALDQAVEQASSTDGDDLVTELTGMAVEETLKGRNGYRFQEYNNQARSPMSVAMLSPTEEPDYWDASIQPSRPLATLDADETTVEERGFGMDCRL